jgi:hypothetical protein
MVKVIICTDVFESFHTQISPVSTGLLYLKYILLLLSKLNLDCLRKGWFNLLILKF